MQGVFLPPNTRLPHWEPICLQWVATMVTYCVAVRYQDSFQYYFERTHAGILSLVAGQCGHQVIPEVWSPRVGRNGWINGWIDVCILNTQLDRIELVECKLVKELVECKRVKRKRSRFVFASKGCLQTACTACDANMPEPLMGLCNNIGRVGVAFAVRSFNTETAESDIASNIQSVLTEMKTERCCFDAMAWYFPERLRRTLTAHTHKDFVPGVVLLVKDCSYSSRQSQCRVEGAQDPLQYLQPS
jgi:hypothetical protein